MIISFDTIPACDRRTYRHVRRSPLRSAATHKNIGASPTLGVLPPVHNCNSNNLIQVSFLNEVRRCRTIFVSFHYWIYRLHWDEMKIVVLAQHWSTMAVFRLQRNVVIHFTRSISGRCRIVSDLTAKMRDSIITTATLWDLSNRPRVISGDYLGVATLPCHPTIPSHSGQQPLTIHCFNYFNLHNCSQQVARTDCAKRILQLIYTVFQKTVHFCLCQNFVKFPLTFISFGMYYVDGKVAVMSDALPSRHAEGRSFTPGQVPRHLPLVKRPLPVTCPIGYGPH